MSKITKTAIIVATVVTAWYLSTAAANVSQSVKASIDSDVSVEEVTTYSDCGHSETAKYKIPASCYGLTPEKAADKLGGKLTGFENGVLRIKKVDASCCEHHYKVTLEGNVIKVTYVRTGRLKSIYNVSPSAYPESDRKKLTAGVRVDSDAELASLVEAYTS